MTRDDFFDLIVLSVRKPRLAAREIIDMELPAAVLWNAALVVVILSVLLTYAASSVSPENILIAQFNDNPMSLTILSASSMIMLVFGLFWTGRMLGGRGQLAGFIAVVVWIQFLWLLAQLVQTVLVVLSPFLAASFGFAALIYGLWMLVQFITEAHNLENAFIGAATLVLAAIGVTVGLSILVGLIGASALMGIESYV